MVPRKGGEGKGREGKEGEEEGEAEEEGGEGEDLVLDCLEVAIVMDDISVRPGKGLSY